jgi:hypothetical protein
LSSVCDQHHATEVILAENQQAAFLAEVLEKRSIERMDFISRSLATN